ncbi:hypothetical protein MMC08_008978, partial [Hypocenomyce scalaris]|nr:hypothetical protein [Hypocenomyce scalaris]
KDTPTDVNLSDHLSITHRSKPPTQPFTTPFLDWSVSDIYTFFLSHVRPLGSELSGAWHAHTFLILDVRTPAHKTYLLCSDMLDFLEEDNGAEDPPGGTRPGDGGSAGL